jgi:hypothetical protein
MALQPQVDRLILVYTVPYVDGEVFTGMTARALGQTNISWWWNVGLNLAQEDRANWIESVAFNYGSEVISSDQWDVAIINDDAIVPEGWFEAVSSAMRERGAAAACSSGGVSTAFFTKPSPVPGWPNPLTGYAFMLAGEKGLRANEKLLWWFTDNYIDWESRKLGGTVVIPGFPVQHLYPNGQMDHALQVQSAADAQTFADLYGGMRPW